MADFEILTKFLSDDAALLKTYEAIEQKTAHITDATKKQAEIGRLYRAEIEKITPGLQKQLEIEEKLAAAQEKQRKQLSANIRDLRARAREITTSVRLLNDTADDINRFATPLAVGGTALVAGIFAAANKYVKEAKVATQVTEEWKAAQDSLNRSGERIGAVLAQEALPLLKQAAAVTEKIASFIERNPEIVDAALKGGLIAATLGTIGKAVSGGIKLYADLKLDAALALQNEAAGLQLQAARLQLQAAGLGKASDIPGGGITKVAGGGGLAATLGQAAVLLGSFTVGLIAADKAFDAIQKHDVTFRDYVVTLKQAIAIDAKNITDFVARFRIPVPGGSVGLSEDAGQKVFQKVAESLGLLKTKADDAAVSVQRVSFLGGTQENQDAIVKQYTQLLDDQVVIRAKYEEQHKQLISDSEAEISSIRSKYARERPRLAAQTAEANARAEQQYNDFLKQSARDRAQIITDGETRIREIIEQAQEERQRIEEQFAEAKENATRRRDALALEDAEKERDRALRGVGTGEAIQKKERDETAARLKEFDARFAAEREQRYAQFQQEVKDNNARLAEFDRTAAEELRIARETRAKKLADLYNAEKNEISSRQKQFVAQLRDLGVYISGERNARNLGYNAILADAKRFIASYQAALKLSTSALPGKQSGGYTAGLVRTGEAGYEYVLSHPTTRAIENILGGQITQQKLLSAIMGGGGRNIVWHDQRRFSGEYTEAIRREVKQDTRKFLREALTA